MSARYLYQPFRIAEHGGVSVTDDADRHLRDKVMAVLFTAPGERVNNPTFGVGINRAVFEPLDPLTLTALEFRISQGLRRDIGDEIIVEGVDIQGDEDNGELLLSIRFQRRGDRLTRNLEVKL